MRAGLVFVSFLLAAPAHAACDFTPGVTPTRDVVSCLLDHVADFAPGDVADLLSRVADLEDGVAGLLDPGPRVVTGATTVDDWVAYSENGIYVDVDTSGAGFETTPHYVTSLHGTSSHWTTTGATSVYNASPTGFRVYIYQARITPELAADYGWHLEWVAVEAD